MFAFGAVAVTVATTLGSTVSVTGVEGSTTGVGGFCGALGSLLYGNCANARSTMLYVPGGAFGFTTTAMVAASLPGAMLIGWLLLTSRLGTGSATTTWSGTLKSGQIRASFSASAPLSPCTSVALSMLAVRPNGALSRTASSRLRSSRLTVGMFCCGWIGQTMLAERASCVIVWPLMAAVPLILISPVERGASAAADSTNVV